MPEPVHVRHDSTGVIVTPAGAPNVLESAAGLDTLVLETAGGHLSWSLLAGQWVPAAALHDPVVAQDWLWAVYGEPVALAVAERTSGNLPAEPVLPDLVDSARRLAYAHWATRWWPTSSVDGIAALDRRLLDAEIAELTEACDPIVDGPDAQPPAVRTPFTEVTGQRQDYALAAGATASTGLILAAGTTGWDWRRCPPGILDASEHAVSWRLTHDSGSRTVRVEAVCAPDLTPGLPAHLWPHAHVTAASATTDLALTRTGDTWSGTAGIDADDIARVDVHVPGVGPSDSGTTDAEHGPRGRQLIRDFAAHRLRAAPATLPIAVLRAEIAAAASDSDF
ncbi:hypothetical protein AB0L57_10385 [Nocardia sp. NPDC052254]|uniref:hypothetical protein n=1 Tax=Nocardia sp. NPDC052254 TaxID=3155681 RepID=UPI003420B234